MVKANGARFRSHTSAIATVMVTLGARTYSHTIAGTTLMKTIGAQRASLGLI